LPENFAGTLIKLKTYVLDKSSRYTCSQEFSVSKNIFDNPQNQAAIPGVFHGALYEKARAGRNGRPFLLAHATWVAAGSKRAALGFATFFRSQNLASAR
jgi:hypothetical protein